jgi:hypothetical protein
MLEDANAVPATPAEDKTVEVEKKLHTDEEVNAIVKARVARVESKYVGYEDFKRDSEELKTVKGQLGELSSKAMQVNEYEGILKEAFEDMLNNVEESKRTLIPETFSIKEKINYLKTNRSVLYSPTQQAPTPAIPQIQKLNAQNQNNDIPDSMLDPIGHLNYWKTHKH